MAQDKDMYFVTQLCPVADTPPEHFFFLNNWLY